MIVRNIIIVTDDGNIHIPQKDTAIFREAKELLEGNTENDNSHAERPPFPPPEPSVEYVRHG